MYNNRQRSKLYLIISVIINVGLLAYFKYANFFFENVNAVLSAMNIHSVGWTKVVLPIGISFFTFQSLTYTVDVYRNVHKPLNRATDFLLYILMFPQLIAGPIVRFNTIADDILNREEKYDDKLLGIYRFVIGLSKKVLIANILGKVVDEIYAMSPADVNSATAWIAVIAYSFQIYFDFAGYSDMAIGLGKIMGFKFPENFNNPYISRSISEFWRRWHMTLGAWMKDYLYIPLGGNRVKTKSRLYANLWIVFLISGLWHGASWNFVIWGAWHGLFLILDRIFLSKVLKFIGKVPSIIFTYIVVLVGWVLFRVEDLNMSFLFIKKMFVFDFAKGIPQNKPEFYTILIIGAFFSFITVFKAGQKLESLVYYRNYGLKGHIAFTVIALFFMFLCSSYITSTGFNPFIYFRF